MLYDADQQQEYVLVLLLTAEAGDLAIMSVPPRLANALSWPLLTDPRAGVRAAVHLIAKKQNIHVTQQMPTVSDTTCSGKRHVVFHEYVTLCSAIVRGQCKICPWCRVGNPSHQPVTDQGSATHYLLSE